MDAKEGDHGDDEEVDKARHLFRIVMLLSGRKLVPCGSHLYRSWSLKNCAPASGKKYATKKHR